MSGTPNPFGAGTQTRWTTVIVMEMERRGKDKTQRYPSATPAVDKFMGGDVVRFDLVHVKVKMGV